MKTDRLLAKSRLKGADGDAMHAVPCGARYNLRLILAHLRVRLLALLAMGVIGLMPTGSDDDRQRLAA